MILSFLIAYMEILLTFFAFDACGNIKKVKRVSLNKTMKSFFVIRSFVKKS